MRTIGVVTTARSDYGCLLPVLRRIKGDPELTLHLIVGGMHLSPEFGLSVRDIEEDGFDITERVEMLLSSDTPEAVAKSMGLGTLGFAQAFGRNRPDILLVLGDRYEVHAAVTATLPFKIPVAHIHGGESTEGAIDESLRHSITKMSHLHFVATETYARRVMQMGEEPWRIMITGAPALDNVSNIALIEPSALGEQININLAEPGLLVTFHPPTLGDEDIEYQLNELLAALENSGLPVVFTYPNADAKGRLIIETIGKFVENQPRAHVVPNLGTQCYFSLMNYSLAMVGNSSSGIIEAASFGLPVVNVGDRQQGRLRPENVIDVSHNRAEILAGIKTATSAEFRARLDGLKNPYGDGDAAGRILNALKQANLDHELLRKRFHNIGFTRRQSRESKGAPEGSSAH